MEQAADKTEDVRGADDAVAGVAGAAAREPCTDTGAGAANAPLKTKAAEPVEEARSAAGSAVGSAGKAGGNSGKRASPLRAGVAAGDLGGSRRRSERIRNASVRSEELRRARSERQAAERAREEARSAAAKKGAKTKRAAKRNAKLVITLRYANRVAPPAFEPIVVDSKEAFWNRVNLREFLLRFDKLCRLPARFTPAVNDPLTPWTPDLFKAVMLAMLKLVQNDNSPLHPGVRTYIAEIDQLDAADPRVWDWLLEFVEQLDAFAPTTPPQTESERLDLVRRLMVVCTGTETIRITVMSDVDQLKLVERDTADEVKQVYAKLKDTEHKLAKLKQVDRQVHREKVAAAQRSADTKAWRAQQQLYQKVHKFNMRTTPMAVDRLGTKYWSLQYKSKEHAAWGSWIMCESLYDPAELAAWQRRFGLSVSRVLDGRDAMVAGKAAERQRQRKEARARQAPAAPDTDADAAQAADADADTKLANVDAEADAKPAITDAKPAGDGAKQAHPKRRYPKLKIDFPKPFSEPRLYYVAGRDNIAQLAEWFGGLRDVDPKMKTSISDVANYLATE